MNRDLISHASKLYTSQARNALRDIDNKIAYSSVRTQADVMSIVFQRFRNFFASLGGPTTKKRHIADGTPPQSSDINDTMEEVQNDIRVGFDELYLLGQSAAMNFDYSVAERARLRNKLQQANEMLNDYTVTARNTKPRNIVVQDTFTSLDKIDFSKTVGTRAKVHTKQGFVTLAIDGAVDNCNYNGQQARVIRQADKNLEGNGWPSNFGIVRRKASSTNNLGAAVSGNNQDEDEWELLWSPDENGERHDDPAQMFDGSPHTWFEYQIINFPDEYKQDPCMGYGLEFDDGSPIYYGTPGQDKLTLVLTIELPGDPRPINWIRINPHFYSDAYGDSPKKYTFVIDDIQTSVSGTELDSFASVLPEGKPIIMFADMSTQIAPDDMIDRHKYVGQAVVSFQPRVAKFIRIEMHVDDPYTCPIGHVWWEQTWTETTQTTYLIAFKGKEQVTHHSKRVEGAAISKELVAYRSTISDWIDAGRTQWGNIGLGEVGAIVGGLVGAVISIFANKQSTVSNVEVMPRIEACEDGWRWAIGLRDVEVMTNTYAPTSSVASINYVLPKEIESASISVNEYIPEAFWASNLPTRNDWIRYYLSFDGGNTWTRVSPIEHQPIADVEFPPQVVILNSQQPEDMRVDRHAYATTDGPANTIMFRADISRPPGDDSVATPVLHDYTIRISPKEALQ
jgi:hypothetical protein